VGRRGWSCLSSVWRRGDGGQKQPKQQPARSKCLCQRRGNDSSRARTSSIAFNLRLRYLSGHSCLHARGFGNGGRYSVSVAAVCNIYRQRPQPLQANQYTDVTYKQKALFIIYSIITTDIDYLYTTTHNQPSPQQKRNNYLPISIFDLVHTST